MAFSNVARRLSSTGSARVHVEEVLPPAPLLFHRIAECTGEWRAEHCGTFQVYRCTGCHTRHTIRDETIRAVATESLLESELPS